MIIFRCLSADLIFCFEFLQTTFDYYLQSPIRGYNHTTLRKIVTILLFSPNKIPWCVSHDFCCKRFNHISFSSYFVNWASTKDFLFYCIERRNHRNAVPVGKWWRLFFSLKAYSWLRALRWRRRTYIQCLIWRWSGLEKL